MKHLNFTTPFLSYANEAVLPFYIFHQTVLLSVGYLVFQWALPAGLSWAIIATASFAIIMLLYEYLVRRHNTLRFLFGMKAIAQAVRGGDREGGARMSSARAPITSVGSLGFPTRSAGSAST